MSLLDWNSIENSRHGITFSYRGPSQNNLLQLNKFEEILPPYPVVKNPNNFVVTFDVNFKTNETNFFINGLSI
jgi:hypothetical protein